MRLAVAGIPVLLALAGCAGSGDQTRAGGLDTGAIPPGVEKTLTFADDRTYRLHCDPHPFMKHNVTAQAGGATGAHVHILDGPTTNEYQFDPQNVTVLGGTTIAYHNHGSLEHTATELSGLKHGGH